MNRSYLEKTHRLRPMIISHKVLFALGVILLLVPMVSIFNVPFIGLHLGPIHSLILAAAGLLSFWTAVGEDKRQVFVVSLGLGVFFASASMASYFFRYPVILENGTFNEDTSAVNVIPNLILGLGDFLFHGLLGIGFLMIALHWSLNHGKKKI